jgi:EAL domain-containing protein (putative c-di-GMP-specific phosphodiesterase class I)
MLRDLKLLGIKLSIDDFGTGYSSLSHLKSFPVDTLKIDRSFVRDVTTNPDDAAIAEAIIAMAKALRREIVAEGVENHSQAQALRIRGCHQAQGYFFAPALPAEKCRELLVRQAANLPFVPQRYVDKGRH